MIHQRRNLLAAQRGQAAIVGVIVLFMLALGMYTTYSLGRAVTEKIKLQNIADATAYSMAATEARTFNFIAFANRCQIAHYISLMAIQANISSLTFTEGALGSLADITWDAGALLRTAGEALRAAGVLLSWIPGVGSSMIQAGEAMIAAGDALMDLAIGINNAYRITKEMLNAIDPLGGLYTYVVYILNWLYWAAGWTMAVSTFSLLAECGYSFAVRSDPTLRRSNMFLWPAFGIYNGIRFNQAFDPVGGAAVPFHVGNEGQGLQVELSYPRLLPGSSQTSNNEHLIAAQRLMTELVNASRYDRYLLNRPIDPSLGEYAAEANEQLDGTHGEINDIPVPSRPRWAADDVQDAKNDAHGAISEAQHLINSFLAVKEGASKMLTERDGSREQQIKDIDKRQANYSKLSRGTGMGSYDRLLVRLDGKDHMWSIFAGIEDSFHCRYSRDPDDFPDSYPGIAHSISAVTGALDKCYTRDGSGSGSEVGDESDGNHPWPGIAPYLKFFPTLHGLHAGRTDFNQPDVWVWLNRPPEDMELTQAGDLDIAITQGGVTATLSGGVGEHGMLGTGLLEGVNALARGEAYYHRPGSWREPPNFFNPFWRGRLAPAGIVLQEMLEQVPGLNQIDGIGQIIANNILTH